MEKMKNGAFSNFYTRYEHTQCVIWLEEFDNDCLVHITNEWWHVFHSSWLFEWYENMALEKTLKWPHWSSPNYMASLSMADAVFSGDDFNI